MNLSIVNTPIPRIKSLSGANIQRANFTNAILIRTNFTRANLTGAIMRGADFKDANLKDTILRNADLTGALNLTKEQIAEAIIDETTILPDYLK